MLSKMHALVRSYRLFQMNVHQVCKACAWKNMQAAVIKVQIFVTLVYLEHPILNYIFRSRPCFVFVSL
jgi:hypothetical protein